MKAIVEKSKTGYCACIKELDGVAVAAKTLNGVKRDLEKALLMHIEGLKEDGELPEYLQDPKNLIITYDVPEANEILSESEKITFIDSLKSTKK